MTDNERLADLLFGSNGLTPEDCELRFPPRGLPEGARVTRFSPSPTGYLHIGGLFGALVDFLTARVSGGLTYLRIEDTDKKREVADGVSAIINGFKNFGLEFDEGVTGFDTEKGAYGPYTQSKRVEIYHAVAKRLVQEGKAYPCFCTADELAAIREEQEKSGAAITGYFGKWAKCRDLSFDEQKRRIEAGEPYVLRFRSEGDENKRIVFDDMIRGKIEMPENIIDEVLLKSDGVPTYHFAHVCDDHFMRTTHVIRGEEWISSVPKHIALFNACGYRVPKYAHTPQVMKIDEETGAKRKLSKRKDPEAAVSYFVEQGYPKESVIEYIMTLLNSNFEDWRRANPTEDCWKFPFNLKKMSVSGCLFDMAKLNDVSKNIISHMTADEVFEAARARLPGISRATVYRNLGLMERDGQVCRVRMAGAPDRFDRVLAPHEHIRCPRCGELQDVTLGDLRALLEERLGRQVGAYELNVSALCDACMRAGERKEESHG